jgi:cell division protein FtsB
MKISQLNFNFSKNISKILIIIGTLLLAFVIFADYGFFKRIELEQQVNKLDKQIQVQKNIRDSIKNNIIKLTYDTTEIERIAREKYGMIKPNEEVYHIKKK